MVNVQIINIENYPIVLFSDCHCNIKNIKVLQKLYPNKTLVSLGDITNLWAKPGERFNQYIINFFIKEGIPNLLGNHCQHVLSCSTGNSLTYPRLIFDEYSSFTDEDKYELNQQQIDYLKKLPIGFKLKLPNNNYYLCYHNTPKDLWAHYDYLNANEFQDKYPINDNCLGIIHGHLHKNFIHEYGGIKTKRISLGQLCNTDRHSDNTGGNYLLLTKEGVEFKKL